MRVCRGQNPAKVELRTVLRTVFLAEGWIRRGRLSGFPSLQAQGFRSARRRRRLEKVDADAGTNPDVSLINRIEILRT